MSVVTSIAMAASLLQTQASSWKGLVVEEEVPVVLLTSTTYRTTST
jgi:hypothetical protein